MVSIQIPGQIAVGDEPTSCTIAVSEEVHAKWDLMVRNQFVVRFRHEGAAVSTVSLIDEVCNAIIVKPIVSSFDVGETALGLIELYSLDELLEWRAYELSSRAEE